MSKRCSTFHHFHHSKYIIFHSPFFTHTHTHTYYQFLLLNILPKVLSARLTHTKSTYTTLVAYTHRFETKSVAQALRFTLPHRHTHTCMQPPPTQPPHATASSAQPTRRARRCASCRCIAAGGVCVCACTYIRTAREIRERERGELINNLRGVAKVDGLLARVA